MSGRYYPSPTLDEDVAQVFIRPKAARLAAAIRDDVRQTGPLDEGVLRTLVSIQVQPAGGTVVLIRVLSSRPNNERPQVDVAAFVEFGTRFMTPRRYMARSSRRQCAALGYGRFSQSSDPWPHR